MIVAVQQPATGSENAEATAAEAPSESTTNAFPSAHSTPSAVYEGNPDLADESIRTNRITNLTVEKANDFQVRLETGKKLRETKDYKRCETVLVQLLESAAPDEIKRSAILELALAMQEQKFFQRAQQLYSEYVRRYSTDPAVPEVLLRQGYLYRDMGVPVLALSKFFGVISTCLNLQLEQMDYYQKLVLRAQAEIAETYYLQGKYEDASDYYNRLLKLDTVSLNRADVLYKLLRCYSNLDKKIEAVACARLYIEKFPDENDVPETRFLLAENLKKLGRNSQAMQAILELLQNQHEKSKTAPQQWLYWQQRAGNTIANQLYREGDYLSALQVYQTLAEINKSPEWQIPVWYQIGLVYENLKQPQKAADIYDTILKREAEFGSESAPPAIKAIMDMATWRKEFMSWESAARAANLELEPPGGKDQNL